MKIVSNKWQGIITWGENYLPRIFFRKIVLNDGHVMLQRKWITIKNWNESIKEAQELYDKLNWK